VGLLLAYEHSLVSPRDLRRLNAAFFTMNGVIAMVFFCLCGRGFVDAAVKIQGAKDLRLCIRARLAGVPGDRSSLQGWLESCRNCRKINVDFSP
jgi:hypothetical protein